MKKKVLDGKGNDGRVKSYTKEIQSLNRELEDLRKQSTRLMRLFTSGRIDEGQFDDEYSILQEKTTELQKKRDGIQSQLNLIDDPQKWISWLDEFDKEVDELVNLKDDNEKREVLSKYVDVIVVDSQDGNHKITLNLTYPIVNDKLVYKNTKRKRDGYTLREGSKSIVVNTKSIGKKTA